mgnify:FL=1
MTTKSYKIAVVGNHDAILPFQMIGFDIYPVRQVEGLGRLLAQLAKDNYGIIYLTEDYAQEILAYYQGLVTPALILIPTHKGSLGIGKQQIQDNVEKAVGQNIL